ncbi:FecR domain-containing protein [Xylophilus sp. GW821-FHT01B05]
MNTAIVAPEVARQAVQWLLDLQGGRPTEQQRGQWQAWLQQSPEHAQAWARIAEVDAQLRGISAPLALQTLAAPGLGRRHAAKLAVLLAAGTGGLLAARQTTPWQQWTADLATATGERRETVLADGTRLQLNTASAVDVRFGATERLLVLRAGEILVQTGPDLGHGSARPLLVRTAEGSVQPIGTRFTVRQQDGYSAVAVLQGAVELRPDGGTGPALRLQAGQQGRFTREQATRPEPLREADSAWSEGMILADAQRLSDFITELARYRRGLLRCAPEAAELRVSGSYPLADTDRVLAALTRSLPVQIQARTRWWVTVVRR